MKKVSLIVLTLAILIGFGLSNLVLAQSDVNQVTGHVVNQDDLLYLTDQITNNRLSKDYDYNQDGQINVNDIVALRYDIFFFDAMLGQKNKALDQEDIEGYSKLILQFEPELLSQILGGSKFDLNKDNQINVIDIVALIDITIRYDLVDKYVKKGVEVPVLIKKELPDLYIKEVKSSKSVYQLGDRVYFKVLVANNGDQDIKDFKLRAIKNNSEDNEHFLTQTINQVILAGQSKWITFGTTWLNSNGRQHNVIGQYDLLITIDPFNEIKEVNEDNNYYKYTIEVIELLKDRETTITEREYIKREIK